MPTGAGCYLSFTLSLLQTIYTTMTTMNKIICESYSTFTDPRSGLPFARTLDLSTGCFVGVADATDEQAEGFEGRENFRVLTSEQFAEWGKRPKLEAKPTTGDPLKDAAQNAHDPAAIEELKKLGRARLQEIAEPLGLTFKGNTSNLDAAIAILDARAARGESAGEPAPSTAPPTPPQSN